MNGCLTITNFMIHRDTEGAYTDVDIIAVRFPHRTELETSDYGAMEDHHIFTQPDDMKRIDVLLVEVKTGEPRLNKPLRASPQALAETLKRLGFWPSNTASEIARELHHGSWSFTDDAYRLRVFCIARSVQSPSEEMPLPEGQQLTWENDVQPFIYRRFREYRRPKSYNNWRDMEGDRLYMAARRHKTEAEFVHSLARNSF